MGIELRCKHPLRRGAAGLPPSVRRYVFHDSIEIKQSGKVREIICFFAERIK